MTGQAGSASAPPIAVPAAAQRPDDVPWASGPQSIVKYPASWKIPQCFVSCIPYPLRTSHLAHLDSLLLIIAGLPRGRRNRTLILIHPALPASISVPHQIAAYPSTPTSKNNTLCVTSRILHWIPAPRT
jgi:hypothetical protein